MKVQNYLSAAILLFSQLSFAETQKSSIEERRATAMGAELDSFSGVDGKIYREVVITRIDDGGISIRHATGTARLRYADLTSSQKEQFGIDPADALATYRLEATVRNEYEQAVAEKEKKRATEANERYRARLEAEKAAQIALEQQQLSAPIPSDPPVKYSQALIPQKSTSYRRHFRGNYSNFGFFPQYRFQRFHRPARSYGQRYGFSYRSPNFNIIFR